MREKREFNFALRWLESDPAARQLVKRRRRRTWGTAFVLICLLLVGGPWVWTYKLEFDLKQLDRKISAFSDLETLLAKSQAVSRRLKDQERVLELARIGSQDPRPVLDRLRRLLPPGTVVDAFSLKENAVDLKVTVPTPVDVAQMWTSLENSYLFVNVDVQALSLRDKAQTLSLALKLNGARGSQAMTGGK
ncbi:Fimbrial assembly protein (PilN) [Acididesulfobacillus acetoxydans]|uniref:Fimbrial assembly protein (PilN) n=1 Tax=Acididesulfobacillus acetoxydans TaxID=1561005 RepID=A0A8S0WYM9_9FIRM|nr:PilN domain-containing protein [Acididesulfobacillus acetoxydans]CAA7601571.1 Fimbrial assembly protein (PilN) [Acididesulfobacillus acetoxydans]CEJ07058.1 Fimbrial assembly protein (PilN) [Acididesulfobacillus acetoxydans]